MKKRKYQDELSKDIMDSSTTKQSNGTEFAIISHNDNVCNDEILKILNMLLRQLNDVLINENKLLNKLLQKEENMSKPYATVLSYQDISLRKENM